MTSIFKLSALAAVLVATATFAPAATITIGSYGASNPGFANTTIMDTTTQTVAEVPGAASVPGGLSNAVAISPNTAWAAAGSAGSPSVQSTWISFEAGTGAGPTVVAPNGFYSYYTTFSASTTSTGSIWVLADDTSDVYLNGVLIESEAPGANSVCQNLQPNCLTPTLVTLSGFVNGTNVLEFDVDQSNAVSTGLDFYGTVTTPTTVTPEPGTLLLLGTGLIGSGLLFRRMSS